MGGSRQAARRAAGTIAALLLLAVPAAPVRAATPEETVLAETLYQEGRRLMARERFVEACAKLEESQRLDPGTGTLMALGFCHERMGRYALAWAELHEVLRGARQQGRSERVRFAEEHIAALRARLFFLAVGVAPAGAIAGLEVAVDGAPLGRAAWGVSMPLDPGTHTVSAQAPARRPWQQAVVGHAGASSTVVVPLLEPVGGTPPPSTRPAGVAPPTSTKPEGVAPPTSTKPGGVAPPASTRSAGGAVPGVVDGPLRGPATARDRTRRTVALVLGGLSVVALGVGAGYGGLALKKHREVESRCPTTTCDEVGLALNRDSRTAATVADVTISVGLALGAVATYLWLTAPRRSQRTSRSARPMVVWSGSGILVYGRL